MAVNPATIHDLPYDPLKDFKPVYGLTKHNNAVIVPAASSIRTLPELVAASRQR